MREAVILLLPPLTAYMLASRLVVFYRERGVVKTNYRGVATAPALGPALLTAYLVSAAALVWLRESPFLLPATVQFLGFAFLGLWDDLFEENISGFKGHLAAGRRGRLTAGNLKILTALPLALLFAGSLPGPPAARLPALLLIPLSANGINLLDRRPGRAIKAFMAGGLLLLLLGNPETPAALLLLPLLAAVLAVAPYDLTAEGMLGDCGANLLGASLGVAAVLSFPPAGQTLILFFWGALNLLAERFSFTRIIEANPLLRYLDNLGRSREKLP